ncbi:MAG: hypothetical protein ACRD0J_04000 [Acidimicrobiales bacterium]
MRLYRHTSSLSAGMVAVPHRSKAEERAWRSQPGPGRAATASAVNLVR